ncbi:MAG: formyl-CoA transferase, partial [Ramlibacter sp.]
IRESDVMVENFGPGALDRMGFTWERIQELNPKMILASVKGFSDGHHYEDLKVYENVAQCAGGAASTTGWWKGENSQPTISAAALGDSNTGMHLAIGILTAIIGRQQTGKGQKVAVSMQDSVINLCRVKLRDQQRLERLGYLEEYPQYPHEMDAFKDKVTPRGGNAGGGGQPGWILKCKGWETDPNAYIYFTVQGHAWAPICEAIGKPEWKTDPAYMTPKARQPHINEIFATIEDWLKDKTKFEAVDVLRKHDIPCAPVLTMKEILVDKSLIESGTIAEVKHKTRGSYWTVGSPIKFSDMKPEITGSPLLGEHSDEVLAELGYSAAQIAEMHSKEVV